MSRYIDADQLKKDLDMGHLCEECSRDSRKCQYEQIYTRMDFCEWIDNAPSIDIVRCSECKYQNECGKSVQQTRYEYQSVTISNKSVDFCSYGEREGE